MIKKNILIVLIVILFISKPIKFSTISELEILKYTIIFLFGVIIYFYQNKLNENWFRLDLLFIMGFFIVHFQLPLMYILTDFVKSMNLTVSIKENYLNYGVWLASLGGICFLLGLSINSSNVKQNYEGMFISYKVLLWFAYIFSIGFISTAGSNYLSGGIYKGLGGHSWGTGISPYFEILSGFSNILLIILVVVEYKKTSEISFISWLIRRKKMFLILIITNFLLFLWVGDRGGAITLMMAFLIMFSYFIKKISLIEFIVVFLIGAFIMTIIGIGRAIKNEDNIFEGGLKNFKFKSFYSITSELAESSSDLLIALYEIPNKHDYFYGKTMLGDILGTIPFAQTIYLNISKDKEYEINSSDYLTFCAFGKNPHTGLGATIIADIYINFGIYGVIFLMFLYGVFINFLQNKLDSQNDIFWIIVAVFVGSTIFYQSRATLLMPAREILYTLFIFAFFKIHRKKTLSL